MKTWTDRLGNVRSSGLARPFVVLGYPARDRHFATLRSAVEGAAPGARIYFEWARGTGCLVGHAGEVEDADGRTIGAGLPIR